MTTSTRKLSYTIPCSSSFRDTITALAVKSRVNVADLARSALLLVPREIIRQIPDPGGPKPGDREETVLKSGPSKGRPWRRKPRLQARLSAGYDVSTVRRALNLVLVPEPSTALLFGLGLAGLGVRRRTKQTLGGSLSKCGGVLCVRLHPFY